MGHDRGLRLGVTMGWSFKRQRRPPQRWPVRAPLLRRSSRAGRHWSGEAGCESQPQRSHGKCRHPRCFAWGKPRCIALAEGPGWAPNGPHLGPPKWGPKRTRHGTPKMPQNGAKKWAKNGAQNIPKPGAQTGPKRSPQRARNLAQNGAQNGRKTGPRMNPKRSPKWAQNGPQNGPRIWPKPEPRTGPGFGPNGAQKWATNGAQN